MKMSLRFTAGALLALTTQAVCFAQHYTQTNLVANTSGVAPVTDPHLVNPWGLSRASGSPWWMSGSPITELALALFPTVPEQRLRRSFQHICTTILSCMLT